jgi:thiamine kinase-like enzyme
VLAGLGGRYEAIAAAATAATSATAATATTAAKGANTRPLRLIHGDLHLGNVLFTSAAGGGARAVSHDDLPSRIRIIDWQTASLGDPVHDLARLAMENLQSPTFASIHAAATHLPDPTDDATLAGAILLAFAGFVVGLGGRDPSSLIAPDRALVTRLLVDDVLAETLGCCLTSCHD